MKRIAPYIWLTLGLLLVVAFTMQHAKAVGLGPSSGMAPQLDSPMISKTVATLPACTAANEGVQYVITDALVPVLSSAVAGTGAVHVQVTCLNTAWKVTGI